MDRPEPSPILLSRAEAARYCGVSLSTFKLWMREEVVRPVRVPLVSRILFRRSDLDEFCRTLPSS